MSLATRPYQATHEQSDTPLPTVAARAAREAIHAARPATLSIARTLARAALSGTIMLALAGLFAALIAETLN